MIEFQAVSKSYGAGLPALTDISLAIESGEVVFVAGPSGAGKSTLLSLIIRDQEPSAGTIRIDGQNIAALGSSGVMALRRRIGVVPQQLKLLPALSALENVALAAEVAGSARKISRSKAGRLLDRLGVYERGGAIPNALSASEQQRVAIARALIKEPMLLIADEPTASLDGDGANDAMRLLVEARERRTTVVIATHDVSLATRFADRVLLLRSGELVNKKAEPIGAIA